MRTNLKLVPTAILILTFGIASGFGLTPPVQRQTNNQSSDVTKLSYAYPDHFASRTSLPVIRPIAVSPNCLLVPVGDVLYMLDGNHRIVWEYSVDPEIIYDVRVDQRGMIYLAISDGLFRVLDSKGTDIWGNFMNGSAQYSQIAPYKDGLLVVMDMLGYREKGSRTEDKIEYWQNRRSVWTKNFPPQAQLEVWGGKILAVKETTAGKEILEIR
jgi:hypothetical protein